MNVSHATVSAFRHGHEDESKRLATLPDDQAGDVDWRATEAGIREAFAQHFREMLDALAEPAVPPSETPVLDEVMATFHPIIDGDVTDGAAT